MQKCSAFILLMMMMMMMMSSCAPNSSLEKPTESVEVIPIGGEFHIEIGGSMRYIHVAVIPNVIDGIIEIGINDFLLENYGHYPIEIDGTYVDLGWIEYKTLDGKVTAIEFHMYSSLEELDPWVGPLPSFKNLNHADS